MLNNKYSVILTLYNRVKENKIVKAENEEDAIQQFVD